VYNLFHLLYLILSSLCTKQRRKKRCDWCVVKSCV
jgi:hypothetical protein